MPLLFSIFLYFIILSAQAFENSEITYTIKFNNKTTDCINITSLLPTNNKGELTINIPQKGVSSFNISSFVKMENINSLVKRFIFEKPTNVNISYTLCMNNSGYHVDLPILNKNYISLLSLNTFILPNDTPDKKIKINIHMQDAPKNFIFFNSNGALENNTITYDGTINDFASFILMGTKKTISRSKLKKRNIVGLSLDQQQAFPKERLNKIKKILAFQWGLMDDHSDTTLFLNFLISPSTPYLFARHFNNTIAMSIPKNETENNIIRAFSHEYFHYWIGFKLRAEKNPGELLWFIEGIDDYFGLNTAYLSSALSPNEYIEAINVLIRYYYLSPLFQLNYNDLIKNRTIDIHHHQIAQMRGHLAALMLKSNSLTKIVKNMLTLTEAEYQVITPELVEENFKKELSNDEWFRFENFIKTGKGLHLNLNLNNNIATLVMTKVLTPDYGFNLEFLFKNGIIKNINSTSAAYKAGLRNNMKILQYNMRLNEPFQKVNLIVKAKNGFKSIDFNPEVKYELIPQYIPVTGDFSV